MQEVNFPAEEVWDKKKIILGIVCGVLFIMIVGFIMNYYGFSFPQEKVKGITTERSPQVPSLKEYFTLPNSNELEKKLQYMRQEVGSLSIEEIASSSPQVQKILQDITTLQNYPRTQTKELCQKLCSSF